MHRTIQATIVPRFVTKPEIYKLCGEHGKQRVLSELKGRHGAAVKGGNIAPAIALRQMILQLERLEDAEIANLLAHPLQWNVQRISPPLTLEEKRMAWTQHALNWLDEPHDEEDGIDRSDEGDHEEEAPRYGDLLFLEEAENDDEYSR